MEATTWGDEVIKWNSGGPHHLSDGRDSTSHMTGDTHHSHPADVLALSSMSEASDAFLRCVVTVLSRPEQDQVSALNSDLILFNLEEKSYNKEFIEMSFMIGCNGTFGIRIVDL